MGLIAGSIAKALMPGHDLGIIMTIILGIVGAIVGGFLGSAIFGIPDDEAFFDLGTLVLAIVGSVLVLFIAGLANGKKN